ncbi:MAG: hypothetical protein IIY07_00205 [Thermoguttaceae bacterium]|nr:hypothetical protein [Thermoguttaceae bacterium]
MAKGKGGKRGKGVKFDPANIRALLDADGIAEFGRAVATSVARETAQGTARDAKKSIKPGGKNRRSKSWKTSKPGEPPRSHRGTLKGAIRYARDGDRFVVGPEAVGGRSASTLRTLEKGGRGRFVETVYRGAYFDRAKRRPSTPKRPSRPCAKHGAYRVDRPKTARPYDLYGPNGQYKRVTTYRYFYSREEWEAARNSPRFQSWASGQATVSTLRPQVAPRPFMAPALAANATSEKIRKRIQRAAKYYVGSGKRR